MSDIFANNSLIEVEIFYSTERNKYGVPSVTIIEDDEAQKMKADPALKDKVKTVRAKWKSISWKVANDLLQQSMVYNHTNGERETDWVRYRDNRLKAGLIEWSGEDVKDVPCTAENINKLHPAIAIALLEKHDKAVSPEKKDTEKN